MNLYTNIVLLFAYFLTAPEAIGFSLPSGYQELTCTSRFPRILSSAFSKV